MSRKLKKHKRLQVENTKKKNLQVRLLRRNRSAREEQANKPKFQS